MIFPLACIPVLIHTIDKTKILQGVKVNGYNPVLTLAKDVEGDHEWETFGTYVHVHIVTSEYFNLTDSLVAGEWYVTPFIDVNDADYTSYTIHQYSNEELPDNALKVLASTNEILGLPRPKNKFLEKLCNKGVENCMPVYVPWCIERGSTPKVSKLIINDNNTIDVKLNKKSIEMLQLSK